MTNEEIEQRFIALIKDKAGIDCKNLEPNQVEIVRDLVETISKYYDFTPKVKKLKWERIDFDTYLATVLVSGQPVIIYSVEKNKTYNSYFTYFEIENIKSKEQLSSHFSYIDAKTKCENHYRTTVLSLLEI